MNSSKTKKRVLVVDDDEDVREAVRDVLTLAGHQAVVTDLRMPGMDGWQLLAVLQSDQALRRIPVCVLSAEDYAPVPAIRVIRKPFEITTLVELVEALLSRQCQQRCAA